MDGLRVSQGHGPDRQRPSRPAGSAEGLSRGLRALGRPHSEDEEGLPSISAARARAASCTRHRQAPTASRGRGRSIHTPASAAPVIFS